MIQRRLNWKRDRMDIRKPKYSLHPEAGTLKALPPLIDIRPSMSPVFDQGNVGSCTGNAVAGAVEYLEIQELNAKLSPAQAPEVIVPGSFKSLSRLFIYYNERVIDGDPQADNGSSLMTGCLAVQHYGVCAESTWAYDEHLALVKPSTPAYSEGAKHKVPHHYSISDGMHHLKVCLMHGYPFVFGAMLYDSFMSDQVMATGVVPMPGSGESIQGGHALCCVGYDEAKKHFIVRNSWGTSWGDQGYCYFPYEYMGNVQLCDDFWTLRRVA